MNLPNKLTILRVILIPFFIVALYLQKFISSSSNLWGYVALIIFVVASLTDLIDGKIARKYNLVTSLGKFLDPLADKLLVTSALIWFVQENLISALVVIIIIAREFIVTGLRLLAADKGTVIAASYLGKSKTVFQMSGIVLILLRSLIPFSYIFDSFNNLFGIELYTIVIWIATILTLISGFDYIVKNLDVFKEKEKENARRK